MTKGQDVTALYRTHHLDEQKTGRMLEKYYVGEAKIKHEGRFDFDTSGYYTEIRKRIINKFTVA